MKSERTDPELPGEELDVFDVEEGTGFYDPENSDAWLVGPVVEVGSAENC
jgi:hypothetical protein